MKTFTLILLLVCFAFSACKKNDDQDTTVQLNSPYVGTFSRTGMDTSNVTISFENNTYNGSSDRSNYPAICHGSFISNDHTINFTDSCSWTANFDWTLILNGSYNISFPTDATIRIWRTNGSVTDEYLLRRLTR